MSLDLKTINKWLSGFLALVLMVLVFCSIIGLPVMLLWNWVIPDIFGLPEISFWQAVGLVILVELAFPNSLIESIITKPNPKVVIFPPDEKP